jgi:regulator of protease activity HflC (stomatin/prohibitin superfamily)
MSEFFTIVVDVLRQAWWIIYLFSPVKFVLVERGSTAVRFKWGVPSANLDAGIRWATVGQTLRTVHTRLCQNAIDEINLTLRDGTPLRIDGVLTYRVRDLGKFLTASEDTDYLLSEFAEAALQATLCELDFRQFHKEPRHLEEAIRRELQAQATRAQFGVLIKYFRIKKFKVLCHTTQAALAVGVLIDALESIPAELAERPGFGAKVALIAGAQASNVVSDQGTAHHQHEQRRTTQLHPNNLDREARAA